MGTEGNKGPIFTAVDSNTGNLRPGWNEFLNSKDVSSPVVLLEEPAALQCKVDRWRQLRFTTLANADRFGAKTPNVDPRTGAAVLALETANSSDANRSWSLEQILKSFAGKGLDTTKIGNEYLATFIKEVGSATLFKIDNSDPRNAIWCIPGQKFGLSTSLAFEFKAPENATIQKIVKSLLDPLHIKLSDYSLKLYIQCNSTGIESTNLNGTTGEVLGRYFAVETSMKLTVKLTAPKFNVWLKFHPGGLGVTVTKNTTQDGTWTELQGLSAVSDDVPTGQLSKPALPNFLDFVTNNIDFLCLHFDSNGGNVELKVDILVRLNLGKEDSKTPIVRFTFDSRVSAFVGQLLTEGHFVADKSLHYYEVEAPIPAWILVPDSKPLPKYWDIRDLFGPSQTIPQNIPTTITAARLEMVEFESKWSFSFYGRCITPPATSTGGDTQQPIVPAPFTWNDLTVSLDIADSVSFMGSTFFTLRPRPEDTALYSPATIALSLSWTANLWVAQGRVQNLKCGLLFDFFEPAIKNSIPSVLGRILIKDLSIHYTFHERVASSFLLSGIIQLGDLELQLLFQHVSRNALQTAAELQGLKDDPDVLKRPVNEDSTWSFLCRLGSSSQKTTLGKIIDSIVDDAAKELPDFVKNIEVAPASDSQPLMRLKVSKINSAIETNASSVFDLQIRISGVKLSILQISTGAKTRRILRLSVDKFPVISNVPLLDKLAQPFDEMLYMWVSADGDLLQADVDAINKSLESNNQLTYKKATKPDPRAVVIKANHHFIIVNDGQVVLDHSFDIGPEDKGQISLAVTSSLNTSAAGAASNTASKGQLTKQFGPLSIRAVACQFKNSTLWISMDAVLQLGPISLGLLGFGIGLRTTGLTLNKFALGDFVSRLVLKLDGLSLSFKQPPLLMSGMFERNIVTTNEGSQENYLGGVGISIDPYTIVGVGQYSQITLKASDSQSERSFKSVFIYAKLDGPLVQLAFATISGVRLGFGLNSVVRSPRIDELGSFPFINDAGVKDAGNDPMNILKAMTGSWVSPMENAYWFAAGMTVQAFEILAITAVAIFSFREAGVVVGVFADAVAKFPQSSSGNELLLVYIEIGIIAELNFIDGYFRVEASVAPTSFLLVPQCRLTGGFALVHWFGNSPHAGDWVFSVGGYHRAFDVPAHYPRPDRVGVSFTVGKNIQIVGESYFAITPKVAMAGAVFRISLHVGPVDASLDARFDVLINFHPFHYMVDFRIAISVKFEADVLFIHTRISASVSAELHIEGPEFGGNAHVDFYLFAFDIKFGRRQIVPPPQNLMEFWNMAHKPGPDSSSSQVQEPNPLGTSITYIKNFVDDNSSSEISYIPQSAFKFVLHDGNVPTPPQSGSGVPNTGAGSKWIVNGGSLKFSVRSDFPIDSVTVSSPNDSTTLPNSSSIYSKPMKTPSSRAIRSKLTVTIRRSNDSSVIGGWTDISYVNSQLPSAMFGPYSASTDPMSAAGRKSTDLLGSSGTTINLSTGVSLAAPKPVLAKAKIPAFKASAAAKLQVKDDDKDWFVPVHASLQTAFVGKQLTSEERATPLPDRWRAMQKTWKEGSAAKVPVLNAEKGFLSLAAKQVFGWDKRRPPGEIAAPSGGQSGEAWRLTGRTPGKLIDGLFDTYLALPRVAVA